MTNLNPYQFAAPACPECGTPGKKAVGYLGRPVFDHVDTPDDCHHYLWGGSGATVAKDYQSAGERRASQEALRSLNPFKRRKRS